MTAATVAEVPTPTSGGKGSTLNWADAGLVGLLLAVGIGAPLALAGWLHALDVPRNDDWSYRLVLFRFAQTGHYSLQGWGAMTLAGQIMWATPFVVVLGPHPWVPGVAVAVASGVGVVASYWLGRSVLPRWWAAACVLAVLAFPGFLLNTSSFMTDVPAFSAEMACLALGVAALRRVGGSRWGFLAGSLALGCFGFSVREFDLAAPAAVLVVMAAQDRRRLRVYVASGGVLLIACVAIFVWTIQLPGAQPVLGQADGAVRALSAVGTGGALAPSPAPFWQVVGTSLLSFVEWCFTLAFALAPFLALLAGRSWRAASVRAPWRRRWLCASGPAAVLVLGVVLLAANGTVFVGNYLARQGATGNQELPGVRPALFPGPVWLGLSAVAVAAGAVLSVVLLSAVHHLWVRKSWSSSGQPAQDVLVVFSVLTAGGLAFYGVFLKGEMFDRYLWPLVLCLALLLAHRYLAPAPRSSPRVAPRALAVGLAAVAAVVACVVTCNSDSFDGSRWAAGEELVAKGVPATKVDAGFEWVGYHFRGLAVHGREVRDEPAYDKWYEATFPGFSACAIVSSSRLSGPSLRLLGTAPYNELGFAVTENLYLYRVDAPACRTGLRP